jgi:hypothetical protein
MLASIAPPCAPDAEQLLHAPERLPYHAENRLPRMIVSHAHRYIFVPIPKTGTHAVRQALREHMGPGDIEQVGLFVSRKFPWPELAAIGHGHLGLGQVAPYLGPDAMRDYLKFACTLARHAGCSTSPATAMKWQTPPAITNRCQIACEYGNERRR